MIHENKKYIINGKQVELETLIKIKKNDIQDGILTVYEGVEAVNVNSFVVRENIKCIILPESLKYIAIGTFIWGKYEKIIFNKYCKLTEIPQDCFYGCKNLKEVVLPLNVKKIGNGAFRFCSNLNDLEIPENVEEIHENTFSYSGIKKIGFEKNNEKQLTLPKNLKKIGEYAFKGCDVTDLKLPENLETLNESAFFDCKKINEVSVNKDLVFSKKTFPKKAKINFYKAENNSDKNDENVVYESLDKNVEFLKIQRNNAVQLAERYKEEYKLVVAEIEKLDKAIETIKNIETERVK